jgi:hypothetical protein
MSDLTPIDYESLIQEKRADIRSVCGQVVALAVVFVPLLLI